jgi:transcriptional regulator with XRE-family HTH domain
MATEVATQDQLSASNVPATLRALKRFCGLTDQQIADAADMRRSTLHNRQSGLSPATADELGRIAADVYDVPIFVLFLPPDEAIRWVLDHPSEQRKRIKRWIDQAA